MGGCGEPSQKRAAGVTPQCQLGSGRDFSMNASQFQVSRWTDISARHSGLRPGYVCWLDDTAWAGLTD